MIVRIWSLALLTAMALSGPAAAAEGQGQLMKLHETPWLIDGKPILGTYGAARVEDLQRVKDVGMNLVLGGETELDPDTPQGAFCLENGIKVLPHLTHFLYHGVRLREPVSPDQKLIPLHVAGKPVEDAARIIQLDDELIRYEAITEKGLENCERGFGGTQPAPHREGTILFWPEACKAEVERMKDSPNLFGYYVLDDSPGDSISALRAMYKAIREADPGTAHPVCAGFGDAGSIANLVPGVCDLMFIYWYPVGTRKYDRERTAQEVQHMLSTARRRVPGIPFVGIYQAFDGRPAQTGQGVPTGEQLREQLEDFVREGASGLVAFICHNEQIPGWADLEPLGKAVTAANREILETGGLAVRPETASMKAKRIQPEGFWETPQPLPGVVPAWHVVAPFEDTTGRMLDAPIPPENGIDPAGLYTVKDGSAGLRIRETTGGILGLSDVYGVVRGGLAYAYCDVESPEEQTVHMRICTDDDGWVRINGNEVYRFTGTRGLDIDKDVVPVTLPRGSSRIEVKSHNRASMWSFQLRFTDTEGRPLEGLKFTPANQ